MTENFSYLYCSIQLGQSSGKGGFDQNVKFQVALTLNMDSSESPYVEARNVHCEVQDWEKIRLICLKIVVGKLMKKY